MKCFVFVTREKNRKRKLLACWAILSTFDQKSNTWADWLYQSDIRFTYRADCLDHKRNISLGGLLNTWQTVRILEAIPVVEVFSNVNPVLVFWIFWWCGISNLTFKANIFFDDIHIIGFWNKIFFCSPMWRWIFFSRPESHSIRLHNWRVFSLLFQTERNVVNICQISIKLICSLGNLFDNKTHSKNQWKCWIVFK